MKYTKDIIITPKMESMFWARVQRDDDTGCLLWMGATTGGFGEGNYGILSCNRERYFAHRVAYCLHYGVINLEPGHELDHLCRVPPCVDWAHLESVPHGENVARGMNRMRLDAYWAERTHCHNGHVLTPENRSVNHRVKGVQEVRCLACCRASYHRLKEKRRNA